MTDRLDCAWQKNLDAIEIIRRKGIAVLKECVICADCARKASGNPIVTIRWRMENIRTGRNLLRRLSPCAQSRGVRLIV